MRTSKLFAVIAILFLAVSCMKDETILYQELTMATVSSATQLKTDVGLTYNIVKQDFDGILETGSRVLALCNVLKRTDLNEYDIELVNYVTPLKKDAVLTSSLTKPDDGLGNDPVGVSAAWVSGGYLNLGIVVLILDEEKDHVINLEFDDTAPADTLRFTVRHEDGVSDDMNVISSESVMAGAYATFPIAKLLPEGVSSLPIKLTWTWDKEYTVKDGLKL